MHPQWPAGFRAHTACLGIRDDTPDLSVVLGPPGTTCAAVFTRNRFAGPSVTASRRNLAAGRARGVVTISKNANVATGARGDRDTDEVLALVGAELGMEPGDLLIGSTGVIGRPYPMDRVREGLVGLGGAAFDAGPLEVATAMMTTDTRPKVARASADAASVVGVAKGVGMIEPRMATLLAWVFTDAGVGAVELDALWRDAVATTFNSLSIDGDTSTSDSAAVFASGAAGAVTGRQLGRALEEVCLDLTLQLARDGEGATKLLEVAVEGADDDALARRVARSIVNSPLVKTAVHGADPNWGRVAMAVGKVEDERIDPAATTISFGDLEVYPTPVEGAGLEALAASMAADHVRISVSLGQGPGRATVYGCDLSREYVAINADYTT